MKLRNLALFLGIVSYLLAIVEHLLNLRVLTWVYSIIDETTTLYLLIIIGTAFTIAYLVEKIGRPKGYFIAIKRRSRPSNIDLYRPSIGNDFGVKWRLFPPRFVWEG